jgi:CRP-like cAMP-binding protein
MAMSEITLFHNASCFKAFPAGSVIFKEGELGDLMYVVKEGRVELRVRGNLLETVHEKGIFGELAIVDGKSRSASAIAQTDCKLVPVDRERFNSVVEQHPIFAVQVMKIMADRLRRMNARF